MENNMTKSQLRLDAIAFSVLSVVDGILWQQIMSNKMAMDHPRVPNKDSGPFRFILTMSLLLFMSLVYTILLGLRLFEAILKHLNFTSAPTMGLIETKVPVWISAIASCFFLSIVGVFCWLLLDVGKVVNQPRFILCLAYVIANACGFTIFAVMASSFAISLVAGINQGSSKAAVNPVSDLEMPADPNF